MTNTNLRLFAADMDGTLLDNDNAFNRRKFAEVIGILRRQQKKFVIATGNQTIRINKMFLPFDSDGQVISMVAENGAFVQNGQNLLHQSIIDPIKTKRIYDLLPTLNPRPTLVIFAGKDAAFAPTWQESVQVEGTRIFFAGTIDDFYPNWVPIKAFAEINVPIDKISLSWTNDSGQGFLDLLNSDPILSGLRSPISGFGAIDIVNKNADKASGLQLLAKELQIRPEEMAAFGDGLNDLEMLQYVGHPYIMPNSQDELKSYFNQDQYTVSDNNHDGVLDTILKLLDD
ncbi:putative Sugar-phosphatase [Oenococcus oeni]|uniref:HAD family hydrolase n=1 Tax=Oenococcus oeni TaxID=1247 RepID=UPI0010BB7F08|nr:HAD family hydrolase [Oenococcus oeni]SYW02159.1 putative Sugar-phosphatase [Oenococcus oeni]